MVRKSKRQIILVISNKPDLILQYLDEKKVKTDGIKPTVEAVFRKLDTPLPLGYSQSGEVIAVGDGVTEFQIEDRVISNGNHTEIVAAPKNLTAKIPEGVTYEEAAFTVVGAIGNFMDMDIKRALACLTSY